MSQQDGPQKVNLGIHGSALDLIGNTPLLSLDRIYNHFFNSHHLTPPKSCRLLAKVEFMQPGGSIKDRAAKKIIELAYNKGELKKGMTVVEMTSGNMGAGLAVICAITGNPFIAVMSEGNSPERAKMLRGLGAQVVLVPQVTGSPGQVTGEDIEQAAKEAKRIALENGAYYVDQFNNEGSILAHETTTGPEIWNQTNGTVNAFVACVGSGGTFIGTSKYLKRVSEGNVKCVAVEPLKCQVLQSTTTTTATTHDHLSQQSIKEKHVLQGTGYGFIPPHWDHALVDDFEHVSDEEAIEYRQLLAEKEGLFVGYSAAANVVASLKYILKSLNSEIVKKVECRTMNDREEGNSNVVLVATVLCDTGLKY
ncbi:hypothetical protein C9374_003185 [Naegleria lovaniensis]|uniref:Tryptophan synthase beta chain-like PALP domain-containing protein n=1 Tax=Naegleria lovaniensis TaxID=51637 RepID=A0AA88KM40_NAELO|nr:uncharacterized protein C9374_003185 [Naegleria lovaniensis]KAG2386036.1 hypothetical protein C9374_003185 [Naegleria lovaniensis]